MSSPILTFRVSHCSILSASVWIYPANGELYMDDLKPNAAITENSFEFSDASGEGKLIISGVFDSAAKSHGTMKFTKGFDIFGYALPKEVVFRWNAAPY